MNIKLFKMLIVLLGFHLSSSVIAASLAPELHVFTKILGTWQATFKPEGSDKSVTDISKWQRALNGNAIKVTHSIEQGVYGGETFIFYDKTVNSLVFYYFTTAGFFTTGTIEIVGEDSFIANETVTGNQDGITKVKSMTRMLNNKMQVETSFLKNGKWSPADIKNYTPSQQKVIFK